MLGAGRQLKAASATAPPDVLMLKMCRYAGLDRLFLASRSGHWARWARRFASDDLPD